MTELGKTIIKSLKETPEKWFQSSHKIVHMDKSLILSLWTSGIPIIDLKVWEPDNIQLSWKDKWHIHKQIKATNATNLITSINKTLSKEPIMERKESTDSQQKDT